MSLKNFKKKSEETNDYIIPPGLFDVPKKAVSMDIPSCPKNEEFSKRFMKKFSLIINTIFALSGSLRILNSCLN